MAKLSGYRKLVKWIRVGDDFKKTSTETRAESVIMSDGRTLEEKLGDYESDVTWGDISGKPSTYPPSSHNHNELYYTEAEIDQKLNNYSTATFSYSNGTLTITDN